MFYFKDVKNEVSAIWDTVKAQWRKMGKEQLFLTQYSTAEQKGAGAKLCGFWSCRISKSTKGQILKADTPAARKPPHILCGQCYLHVLALVWGYFWILKVWMEQQQKFLALLTSPGCLAYLGKPRRPQSDILCLVTGPSTAVTVRLTWQKLHPLFFSF